MKRNESSLYPRRYFLCSNKEMKMKFEGNIEFSITRGAWKATSQLQVIVCVLSYCICDCMYQYVN